MAGPLVDYHEKNPQIPFNTGNQIGGPEDVAGMAALLAGDSGRYCNAVTFVVDGGGWRRDGSGIQARIAQMTL
jgi:hypothetical protein